MKKLLSILMSLAMTITLCLGCGLTAAAAVDYDAQIKKYEEQIKKDEQQLEWYINHADSSSGYQYTGFSEVVMSSPFIIKTYGFPYGTIPGGYIRITNPNYSSEYYNTSILGTYYSSYVKPLGTSTYTYNGKPVPDYQFVEIETYAPEIQKLKASIEKAKFRINELEQEKKTYNEKKKADYIVYLVSYSNSREIGQLELSVKEKTSLCVGYYDSNDTLHNANENFTWKSSDTKIAKVNKTGSNCIVTGVKYGTATITGIGKETGNKVTLTVKVNPTPTKNIDLAREKLSISCGKKYTMKYTLDEGANDVVHFYSSNDYVAWVSDEGTIHSVHPGTAYIAAFTRKGAVAYCKVTVTNKKAPKEDNTFKAVKAAYAYHTDRIDPEGMAEYYVFDSNINKKDITVSVYNFEDEIKSMIEMYEYNEASYNSNAIAEYTYSISKKSIIKKTIKSYYGDISYKGDYIAAKHISLSSSDLSSGNYAVVGSTAQFTIGLDSKSCGEKYTLTSSNKSIAAISQNGIATFKAPGKVTITCKMEGGATDSVTITVCDEIPKPSDEQETDQDNDDDYYEEYETEELEDDYDYYSYDDNYDY